MKKIIPILLLGFICSCQIQYDISTRLVLEGQVSNRYGDPIENNPIEAWINNSGDSDFIGFTETNSEGYFEMVIPEPTNETDFEIRINGNSNYQQKNYVAILQSDFEEYIFNVGEIILIELEDISQLEITLNQVNAENTITSIELSGIIAEQTIIVNPEQEESPIYYDYFLSRVAKNQTLSLQYEVRNNMTNQTNQFNDFIVIGSDNTTNFTINY